MSMTLFDNSTVEVDGRPTWVKDELSEAWWKFHITHPAVYDELVRLSRRLIDRGHKRLGLKMLWETLRYNTMLGDSTGEYRLTNNHTAFYARLLMEQEPDLAGIFELRPRRAGS